MLTQRERNAIHKSLQEVFRQRAANLGLLCDRAHGWAPLAKILGMNENLLTMMGGANPTRTVTEKQARRIETVAGLTNGWLDERH
jgi:hypothetical protein